MSLAHYPFCLKYTCQVASGNRVWTAEVHNLFGPRGAAYYFKCTRGSKTQLWTELSRTEHKNQFLYIHSFRPFLQRPFKSSTTQRHSRLQHGYCIGVSRRIAQATAGKGLAQDPYMAAREGVEPTTLRLKVIVSTKAPPCPTWWRLVSPIFIYVTHLIGGSDMSEISEYEYYT